MKFLSHDQNFLHDWTGKKSLENVNHRKPVLICDTYNGKAIENAIPILSGFGIPSILDAHKIFQDIYAFLGWLKDNPEIPNNQTDKEKVVAHGFDVKRSFRPTIKN